MSGSETPGWDGVERRVAKRRQHRRYRFVDRRHGFDRRKRHPVLGTMRDHAWIVVFTILLINALSFIDGYFTVLELELEIAREGNPILAAAVQDHGLMVAMAIKFGAMVMASAVIWFGRRRRSILALALVAVAVFGGLVAYHAGTLRGLGLL